MILLKSIDHKIFQEINLNNHGNRMMLKNMTHHITCSYTITDHV